jgi:ApeA N-terminal domain 1
MSERKALDGERTVHGKWWVAESPRSKVAGTLRYGSTEGIRLELSADPLPALRGRGKIGEQVRRWRGGPNVIFGQSDDQRERFTIVDALPVRIGPELLFIANYVLKGRHIIDPSSATFAHMVFELDHLEAWAGGPLLGKVITPDDQTGFHERTLLAFDTRTGHWQISVYTNPFFRERESGTAYTCSVLTTLKSPVTLRDVFGELEKFLSFMTIIVGRPVRPRRLVVRQRRSPTPIEVIASWASKPDRSLITQWEMLAPLSNLAEGASQSFARWFDEWPSIRESVGLLLTACATSFAGVKFLCLISGIESFHRATRDGKVLPDAEFHLWRAKLESLLPKELPHSLREKLKNSYKYANECSLRKRLSTLLRDELKDSTLPYSQRDRNSFIEYVVNARNALAHGTEELRGNLSQESIDLTHILLRLLLMHIGCSDEAIATAVRRLPFCSLVVSKTT